MRVSDFETLTTPHDTLNPDLWEEGGLLKPEVQYALLKIAKEFVNFINVPDLRLTDITLSGSNAAFNYNKNSDIDLHLIADASGPCEVDLKELFLAKKSLFNDQYDVTVLGHEVEVYVQLNTEKHISNGIFSLYRNRWIKEPEEITEQPDITNVEEKYNQMKHDIDEVINSNDKDNIEKLKKKIKKMRQAGLDRAGEFSAENLAFKLLRNDGEIEKLWKAGKIATDDALSLREGNAFSGALATARERGLDFFIVDGKKYKVKKTKKKIAEDNQVNKNYGSYRGRPFWIGVFDTRDGHVLTTYTYEKAASYDFHHSFYVDDKYHDAINNGEAALFWMKPDGSIETEWTGGAASQQIVRAIKAQLDR